MPEEKLTDDQALSVLAKMEVEQRTLDGLWKQFTVAIRQVGAVIRYYQELTKRLPDLQAQREAVEQAIGRLGPELDAQKRRAQDEETAFRRGLETEGDSLRKSIAELRKRTERAQVDLQAVETQAATRKVSLEQDIQETEARLAKAREGLAAFKREHGL